LEQLVAAREVLPGHLLIADLPQPKSRFAAKTLLETPWLWREHFLALFYTYLAYRIARHWNRALSTLQEARCYAMAGEQRLLESWVNELIVEAIAKREAKRS
jgi:hypothetical protein